jgi:hypothetical protein
MNVWDRLRQVEADVEQSISELGWTIAECDHERRIRLPADNSSPPPAVPPDVFALVTKIYEFIDAADKCLIPADNLAIRAKDWLFGKLLMSAYANLHMAERDRVLLFNELQLMAVLPAIRARAIAYLPADQPLRVALDGVPDITAPAHQAVARLGQDIVGNATAPRRWWRSRTALPATHSQLTPMLGSDQRIAAEALGAAYTSEDLQQAQVRRFRSVLFGTFTALVILVVAVWLVSFLDPKLISLCVVTRGQSLICPSGGHAPRTADFALVLGFGAIGASLAVARHLGALKPGVRYSLSVAEGMIKIPLGAITAVLGILLLRTQSDLSGVLGTQAGLLTAAVVFGYGQQLFTGLIDRRTATLLNAASPLSAVPGSYATGSEDAGAR